MPALGQRLVERRPVRATAAGARLAEHANHVLLRLDVARSELARTRRGPSELPLATSPLASPQLLATCLRRLRATRPELSLAVRSLGPTAAVEAVASGEVDAALVDGVSGPNEPLHLAEPGLLATAWFAEAPVVVALCADHPLARLRRLDLDALADAPWVAVPGLPAAGARVGALRLDDLRQPVRYEGADVGTVVALVAAGLGAALLPAWACVGRDVAGVPVGQPRLVHRTELLSLSVVDPDRQQLLDVLLGTARGAREQVARPGTVAGAGPTPVAGAGAPSPGL